MCKTERQQKLNIKVFEILTFQDPDVRLTPSLSPLYRNRSISMGIHCQEIRLPWVQITVGPVYLPRRTGGVSGHPIYTEFFSILSTVEIVSKSSILVRCLKSILQGHQRIG